MSSARSIRAVHIRQTRVDDIAAVYRLGRRLFKSQEASTFYRTWDAYEVTNNSNARTLRATQLPVSPIKIELGI